MTHTVRETYSERDTQCERDTVRERHSERHIDSVTHTHNERARQSIHCSGAAPGLSTPLAPADSNCPAIAASFARRSLIVSAASAGAPQLLQEPSESVANTGLPSCPSKLLAVSSAALIYNARSAAAAAVAVILQCIRYDSGQPWQ